MKIGKSGRAITSISTADADSVTVRGSDLTSDLMGGVSFTEYFFLLTTGKAPTAEQTYFLDLLLVSIAEHGLVPTNQVARMTYAADPDFLQGAVAAGLHRPAEEPAVCRQRCNCSAQSIIAGLGVFGIEPHDPPPTFS